MRPESLKGRVLAAFLARLRVDEDGILILSSGSLPNWKGRGDVLRHLDGGRLLGPAAFEVAEGTAEPGSHSRTRPKTSGPQDSWRQDTRWQKGRAGERRRLLLGFRA
jgi:hypothetical protein